MAGKITKTGVVLALTGEKHREKERKSEGYQRGKRGREGGLAFRWKVAGDEDGEGSRVAENTRGCGVPSSNEGGEGERIGIVGTRSLRYTPLTRCHFR